MLYSNPYDGIVERMSAAGNVGPQSQVVAPVSNCLADTGLCAGLYNFDIAVNETTGSSHIVWMEGYWHQVDEITSELRFRAWYAHDDGSGWSAPLKKINDDDTRDLSIATAPNGGTIMAWFQRWTQSAGDAVSPGDLIVARTAYGETPGDFPLRQATHDLYPEPERDESILFAGFPDTGSFVLVSDHAMWPGHSRAYRYIWENGAWSGPLDVAQNASGWGTPVYVGVADSDQITYVYSNAGILTYRTETNGSLGAAHTIAGYLSARGYNGTPKAYFTDSAGGLHMAIVGEKSGTPGFYYVKP